MSVEVNETTKPNPESLCSGSTSSFHAYFLLDRPQHNEPSTSYLREGGGFLPNADAEVSIAKFRACCYGGTIQG
jgi:hypothetical protein